MFHSHGLGAGSRAAPAVYPSSPLHPGGQAPRSHPPLKGSPNVRTRGYWASTIKQWIAGDESQLSHHGGAGGGVHMQGEGPER